MSKEILNAVDNRVLLTNMVSTGVNAKFLLSEFYSDKPTAINPLLVTDNAFFAKCEALAFGNPATLKKVASGEDFSLVAKAAKEILEGSVEPSKGLKQAAQAAKNNGFLAVSKIFLWAKGAPLASELAEIGCASGKEKAQKKATQAAKKEAALQAAIDEKVAVLAATKTEANGLTSIFEAIKTASLEDLAALTKAINERMAALKTEAAQAA